jgi:hypothetical protein
MSIHEARCVRQGRTFFGVFETAGFGVREKVSVRYNGDEMDALTGGLPADVVAATLLGELVARKPAAAQNWGKA